MSNEKAEETLFPRSFFVYELCAKPPLCKGRWHGVSRDGGIVDFSLVKHPLRR